MQKLSSFSCCRLVKQMFGGSFSPFPGPSPTSPSPSSPFVCINVTDVVMADSSWAKMMLDSTLTEVKKRRYFCFVIINTFRLLTDEKLSSNCRNMFP